LVAIINLIIDNPNSFVRRQNDDIYVVKLNVPHKRLISKLKLYGISDQIINWITSFLANRTQTVLLENTTSEKIAVTSDMPQGTVLGPILFLIYMNDLPDYIKLKMLHLSG
jgi:hypothetical protein